MSMHIEWDTASECDVVALTADAATEDLRPDEEIGAPFVLVLGGMGGGALAIEGDAEDLRAFAERIRQAVDKL